MADFCLSRTVAMGRFLPVATGLRRPEAEFCDELLWKPINPTAPHRVIHSPLGADSVDRLQVGLLSTVGDESKSLSDCSGQRKSRPNIGIAKQLH